MSLQNRPNRLCDETSPYLLQHAGNPVEWYPWCDQALRMAKEENKPILLSIGYSACHWCHVMAHESFEDAETAAVMNTHFINIKVDREERPDLDQIYQLAHQVMAQRPGGWPLTMFLTPQDHIPFYSGTYFPKTPRYNLPGFIGLLNQLADYYQQNSAEITQHKSRFIAALEHASQANPATSSQDPDAALLRQAHDALAQSYDPHYGGFGQAPKFPHPTNLEFLLRFGELNRNGNEQAQPMVSHTLEKMAHGGIYDQLGGGFCRYSVDDRWMIPHFEKMLYDNGPLLALYSQVWQSTQRAQFKKVALESADSEES